MNIDKYKVLKDKIGKNSMIYRIGFYSLLSLSILIIAGKYIGFIPDNYEYGGFSIILIAIILYHQSILIDLANMLYSDGKIIK